MIFSNQFEYGPSSSISVYRRNFNDLVKGIYRKKLVFRLGLTDITQRYRNTYLGPFWMTISLSVFLSVLGYVGGALFNIGLEEYLPYLCLGVLLWTFISSVISESGQLYILAPISTVSYDVPMSTFVYSFLVKHTILLAHNLLLYFVIAAYFKINFLAQLPFVIIGMLILMLFCLGITFLLAVVCTKLRDIPQIVANLLQVSFFVTPIMWNAELLAEKGRKAILDFNPFYYLLEVVRAPMLGQTLGIKFYLISIAIASVTLVLGISIFIRYRHRVMFFR